jgi:hypothetical protein
MGMTTGMITPMSDTQEPLMSAEYQKYFREYQKELEKRMKSQKALPPSLQAPSLKAAPVETKKTPDVNNAPTTDNKAPAVTQAKTPEVTPKTPMELFLEQNAADREALLKQRSEDRNMALLAAGLGMMGGESPYAFTNIGKGALSGVSYLSDANKQRAATQAALDRNRMMSEAYGREPEQVRALRAISADPKLSAMYLKSEAKDKISRTDAVKEFNDIVEKNPTYRRQLDALGIKDPNAYYQYLLTGIPPLAVSSTIPQGAKTRP